MLSRVTKSAWVVTSNQGTVVGWTSSEALLDLTYKSKLIWTIFPNLNLLRQGNGQRKTFFVLYLIYCYFGAWGVALLLHALILNVSRSCITHPDIKLCAPTCTIAHSFVFDDVFMLEGFQDLDFPLKVSEVLGRAVLQLLHSHHLPCAVLQRVVAAHLHAAEVSLCATSEEDLTTG